MSMDPDIKQFVDAIGAEEPSSDSENHMKWKAVFKRSNYFRFNGKFMIVKISRSKKPFWGVGKDFVDFVDVLNDYYLVLLGSGRGGWAFSKFEVDAYIKSKKWNLRIADNNYKINSPLPDKNAFFSPIHFLKKFCPSGGSNET